MTYKRGDVVLVDLPRISGSVQYGQRPCVIIQNDVGNIHSPVLIVVPCTTKSKADLPTHAKFKIGATRNIALCEQIITVAKSDILTKMKTLNCYDMREVNRALKVSLSI